MKHITIGNIIQFILGSTLVLLWLYLMWPILLCVGAVFGVVFGLNRMFKYL